MSKKLEHYEDSLFVSVNPKDVFSFADDHTNFSSHMNKSSLMMGGGKMVTQTDNLESKKVGSHIKMHGKVFGIELFLDEVITVHNPPFQKVWQTVGDIRILVIGHYTLGFEISPKANGSVFRVFINYELPQGSSKILGVLFGKIYAKWCVSQMLNTVRNHFKQSIDHGTS